jgi:3-carboxy-cis,cis-muconate cycloisomerase
VYEAAQSAFLEHRPFAAALAGDKRVAVHLDKRALDGLLDPLAYTGLCADMAREAAGRARTAAADIARENDVRR